MEVDASIYRSPKRKRSHVTPRPTVVTSGLSQHISSSSNDSSEELECHSPSTRVTGKFQKLDLQSPIDLPTPPTEVSSPEQTIEPQTTSTMAPDVSTSTTTTTASPRSVAVDTAQQFHPLESIEFTFQSKFTKAETPNEQPSPTASPTKRTNKSPPPSTVKSDQFWQASEITGWTPDDPDEDNYGINGVGYAKTASKAWAISQKRKQQIADYRSRETREARQRRHERRLSGMNSRRGSPKPGSGSDPGSSDQKETKRAVRFDDDDA